MSKYTKIVALDQHQDSITVAIAEPGPQAPRLYGQIASTPAALSQLARRLDDGQSHLRFCYEAGPCGYGAYRQLTAMGHDCTVVAPSLIPRRPGERIKTDRRDALRLAQQHRSGELTPVWVPGVEQEAVRDLVRCREDLQQTTRQLRQRLQGFLLRHGRVYPGTSKGTQAYGRWLETQRFESPHQQVVFQEYIDAVRQMQGRVAALEAEMARARQEWSLGPLVEGLVALRGVATITAMTVAAELGDLTRFDSPRQLMAYVGLVPSEHSSGGTRRQGGITKAGNAHVRRVLAEGAWCYRFAARKTPALQRQAEHTTAAVQAIAWKAQQRLCGRYRHLTNRGMPKGKVCTAIARELLGFIWAIAWELKPAPVRLSSRRG
jgi:transposase